MALSIAVLRSAGSSPATVVARSLIEARTLGLKTAFLCHSHQDKDLALGLVRLLNDAGWRIYVDWQDATMPVTPDRQTALRIQQKIVDLEYFLFLATPLSMTSRWCPWEIGYADGKKPLDRILIVPTEQDGRTHGSEYLELYRKVDVATDGRLGVWEPGEKNGVLVGSL